MRLAPLSDGRPPQRIRLSRHEPLALNDCLLKLGMAPLESDDAAVRALAIRRLWRKLDNIE